MVVLLASCARRPDDVLSNRRMVDVLVQVHRAEGILQSAGYNYGHDQEVIQYYQAVLADCGVSQAQFDSSLVWYTDHPAYFSRVYPRVMRELQKIHDEMERLNVDNSAMRIKLYNDSIFLQEEPPTSDLVAHQTWEMHRYHRLELYVEPDTLPLFTYAIREEMRRMQEEEKAKQQEVALNHDRDTQVQDAQTE